MRRSPIVLGATVFGTSAILAFHPHAAATPGTTAIATRATPAATTRSSTRTGTAAARSTASTRTATAARSATGASISTMYGPVQVRVTVSGRKITAITPLALTGNDQQSQEISAQAEPILRQEALTRQSARIDVVSGATYTSDGYVESLRSALGKLGFN